MNAPEKLKQYDRDAQVVGNIVHLEHFNVVIDDQRLATLFYVAVSYTHLTLPTKA